MYFYASTEIFLRLLLFSVKINIPAPSLFLLDFLFNLHDQRLSSFSSSVFHRYLCQRRTCSFPSISPLAWQSWGKSRIMHTNSKLEQGNMNNKCNMTMVTTLCEGLQCARHCIMYFFQFSTQVLLVYTISHSLQLRKLKHR